MDFDDLDDQEEALDADFMEILNKVDAPDELKDFLRNEGILTCRQYFDFVSSPDELDGKLTVKLGMAKKTTARNAWHHCKRRCKDEVEADKEAAAARTREQDGYASEGQRSWTECMRQFEAGQGMLPMDRPGAPEDPFGKDYGEYIGKYIEDLTAGKITAQPPGPQRDGPVDKSLERRRREAQECHERMSKQEIKTLPPFKKFTKPEVEAVCNDVLPGEMYGLPVPPTLGELERWGPAHLTKCLQAAGTLPEDNQVIRFVKFYRLPMTGQLAAGGSGPKAFITVEYEKEDPDLPLEIFVKMPWACDGQSKENGCDPFYRWKVSCILDYEAQEVQIYRFLGPLLPFKIPKYYYADICRDNTNYILMTEKIQFGKRGKEVFSPGEIRPVAEKYFDFQMQPRDRSELYYALLKCQARMAAWYKNGFFDIIPPDVIGASNAPPQPGSFPWPVKLSEKERARLHKKGESCARIWKEFMTDEKYGPAIYPKEFCDKQFVEAICNVVRDVAGYQNDISMYASLFPQIVGLQHWNLQSDNTYYWYNEEDQCECGLIDWGGCAPASITSTLAGSITSALGEVLDAHEDGFLRCILDELHRECGISFNFYEFRRQWWLRVCTNIIAYGTNIEMEIFRESPREEWVDIKSIWDPILVQRWNVRCYAFNIHHTLKYLHLRWVRGGRKNLHCHDAFLEWKDYWAAHGME